MKAQTLKVYHTIIIPHIVSPMGFVSVTNDSVIVDIGADVVIDCSTTAGPDNQFFWLRSESVCCNEGSSEVFDLSGI